MSIVANGLISVITGGMFDVYGGEVEPVSSDIADIASDERELWSFNRQLKNNPYCGVIRLVTTGENSALGITGTTVNEFENDSFPCLLIDAPKDAFSAIKENENIHSVQPDSRQLLILYDVELRVTDTVIYPIVSGREWDIISVDYHSDSARCVCRVTPRM